MLSLSFHLDQWLPIY